MPHKPVQIVEMMFMSTNIKKNKQTRKRKWEENQLYSHFQWQTREIALKTWTRLQKGTLKRKTETLLTTIKTTHND